MARQLKFSLRPSQLLINLKKTVIKVIRIKFAFYSKVCFAQYVFCDITCKSTLSMKYSFTTNK